MCNANVIAELQASSTFPLVEQFPRLIPATLRAVAAFCTVQTSEQIIIHHRLGLRQCFGCIPTKIQWLKRITPTLVLSIYQEFLFVTRRGNLVQNFELYRIRVTYGCGLDVCLQQKWQCRWDGSGRHTKLKGSSRNTISPSSISRVATTCLPFLGDFLKNRNECFTEKKESRKIVSQKQLYLTDSFFRA